MASQVETILSAATVTVNIAQVALSVKGVSMEPVNIKQRTIVWGLVRLGYWYIVGWVSSVWWKLRMALYIKKGW